MNRATLGGNARRLSISSGAPGQIRTADLLVRSQTLYPTELRARDHYYNNPLATILRLSNPHQTRDAAHRAS